MTQAPKQPSAKLVAMESSAPANLDTVSEIREILFGEIMRSYEKRFTLLEENIAMGIERLQGSLEKRVDDALTELNQERLARETENKALSQALIDNASLLQQAQQTLTESLAQEILGVRDELHEYNQDVEKRLARDQSRLSNYLRELADKLENNLDH
ncbi:MAG: hypothetical protein ACWA5X_10745 [bacterium]